MAAVRLYAVPASHPSAAVERALQLKGASYERIDLITLAHRPYLRARFGSATAPAALFDDGTKVSGSRAILRELDERFAEPPFLPAERDARAHVLRAEQWGEEVLQPLARRVTWAAVVRAPHAMASYLEGANTPLPPRVALLGAPLVSRAAVRVNHADEREVRADLAHLESHLQRADDWIADGVLGGDRPNAADLQIGASIRLLQTLADLAPRLDARPVGELARRWFPDYPGHTPALALPPPWLAAPTPAAA
jgi:glutathione S-transferase